MGNVRIILVLAAPFCLGAQNRIPMEFRQLEMDSKRQQADELPRAEWKTLRLSVMTSAHYRLPAPF